jgi:Sec-independent protein translocase protein TatA/GNAT superfamily N-acetyltransferase
VFGINFEELILILVLAFILFGPQKLPEYAATLGKFVAKLREATSEVTRQYQNPFEYPQEPASPPKRMRGPGTSCPYCQEKVGREFTFCPKCGQRLKEDHYPPQSPDQAAFPEADPQAVPAQEVPLSQPLVRPLREDDAGRAVEIINRAAQVYHGQIPEDCWHDPYMPEEEFKAEIAAGVEFWGYEDQGRLIGVMGRQDLVGVTLIRHAYVDPEHQGQGAGARLLAKLLEDITGPVLVGTWAAAWWAIRFYEKHGFRLITQEEKNRLLNTYWTISPRQVETSVVLADANWLNQPFRQ